MQSDSQNGSQWPAEAAPREIKLYEEGRTPRDWNDLIGASQCAVLIRRVDSETPLTLDGKAVARFRDCTFLLFDRLADARQFCEAKVREFPQMCCDIFDSRGRAEPPLLTIMHPHAAEKDALSAASVRKRTILAVTLFLCSLPLIWWDRHSGGALILPTVLGINMILFGLRLFQWNSARSHRESEQKKRLEVHLAKEGEIGAGRKGRADAMSDVF